MLPIKILATYGWQLDTTVTTIKGKGRIYFDCQESNSYMPQNLTIDGIKPSFNRIDDISFYIDFTKSITFSRSEDVPALYMTIFLY